MDSEKDFIVKYVFLSPIHICFSLKKEKIKRLRFSPSTWERISIMTLHRSKKKEKLCLKLLYQISERVL